jgi:uncharacterized protein
MVPLSFEEISARIRKMDFPETDIVVGIGTGGVIPASLVAFFLGCELCVMTVSFRDQNNNPLFNSPVIVSKPGGVDLKGKKILLVDDVSVTGKTMQAALNELKGFNVKTFALKGKADYVLFPDIKDCVKWPWK